MQLNKYSYYIFNKNEILTVYLKPLYINYISYFEIFVNINLILFLILNEH
nr:MAG TPA: hypothetical protein [Caudoviricetes sp.]